jgi:hypothetical protein
MSFESHSISFNIALVYFGFYYLSLGYLIFSAISFPRPMTVLFVLAGACYLTSSVAFFCSPAFAIRLFPYMLVPFLVSKLSLCAWVLMAGIDFQRWRHTVAHGAIEEEMARRP